MPSKKRRYSRIAITLPSQDLAAADRLALAHDRSRSWIVAEAIRRYAAAASKGPGNPTDAADQSVTATPPRPTGLGASRLAQLTRDLSLTPEERVREAEATLRLTESREQPRAHQVVAFRQIRGLPPMEAPPRAIHMTEYETRVARVCSRLNAERAKYVLMGATAMQLWGTTRATRDIDILIQPTVVNAKRVLRALASLGFGLATEHLAEDVATRAVTMIGDTPNVDILPRAWSVTWEQAQLRATTFEVEGVSVPTASIADLIESKRTGRLQDAADIEVLEEIRRLRRV